MKNYFDIKYNVFLLVTTIISLPFFAVGLLTFLDVVREGLSLMSNGENPFIVLDTEYTNNKVGLSKTISLTCWPLFVLMILCFRVWIRPFAKRNVVYFGIAVVVSFIVHVVAACFRYTPVLWVLILALLLYLVMWLVISANQCLSERSN